MQKFNKANPAHSSRATILCGTLTPILIRRLFHNIPYSLIHGINAPMMIQTIQRVLSKLAKKQLLTSFIQSGRKNDSIVDLQKAIDLGSFSARAELALLCFNQNLPHAECEKAFNFIKDGHRFGCSDCSGMLAHFYGTGVRGVIARCDETAYRLACASAAAQSCFGKMALAHFLKSLLGPIDPDEEIFDVLWTDPFIRNFASPILDVPAVDVPAVDVPIEDVPAEEDPFKDWSESDLEDWFGADENILMDFDKRRIAKLLIAEIQEKHSGNPTSPKVWLNLPAL